MEENLYNIFLGGGVFMGVAFSHASYANILLSGSDWLGIAMSTPIYIGLAEAMIQTLTIVDWLRIKRSTFSLNVLHFKKKQLNFWVMIQKNKYPELINLNLEKIFEYINESNRNFMWKFQNPQNFAKGFNQLSSLCQLQSEIEYKSIKKI